jgi:hypothetical protein
MRVIVPIIAANTRHTLVSSAFELDRDLR